MFPGHRGWSDAERKRKREYEMGLKRFDAPLPAPLPAGDCRDGGQFRASWPHVHAFLTDRSWDDGSPRELGDVMLFVGPYGFACRLVDKARGLVCFVTAAGPSEALAAADGVLASGGGDWRVDKGPPGKKRRGV